MAVNKWKEHRVSHTILSWYCSVCCMLFLFIPQSLEGQTRSILDQRFEIRFLENSIAGHLENLLIQHNVSIAFNSGKVDMNEVIRLSDNTLLLSTIIKELFYLHDYEIVVQGNKVLLTFVDKIQSIRLRGFVKDAVTGEALVGAAIIDPESGISTFSSEIGFYSISIPIDHRLEISYLGYADQTLDNLSDSQRDILMVFDNELSEVVINGSISDNFIVGIGSEIINLEKTRGFAHISGENDVLSNVKTNPAVQSGNEAQTGMYVRGGSDDQNLILFEGIPLYEVSHVAGLANMFMEESILRVDFIANGFPARYGGRLSSVMNVIMKNGNQSQINGSAKASLPGAKIHLEGPIFNKKTTFNIGARTSYINSYINTLVGDVIDYDIDVDYNDILGKITHTFSPSKILSFSYYQGSDRLNFEREIVEESQVNSFRTFSQNDINRSNRVWSLNFKNVLNDKLFLNMYLGGVKYNLTTRGIVDVSSSISGIEERQLVDVLSYSSIHDILTNINFDYYMNDHHRLKFGGGWINHRYNPDARTSRFLNDGVIDSLRSNDQYIIADELTAYVEDTYKPTEEWEIYAGVHLSRYNTSSTSYSNAQPRFNVIYKPSEKDRLTVSFSTMYQYIHQFVNPSIGLPSNFWAPSSENLKPERSDQVSVSYDKQLFADIDLRIGGFYKKFQNLLDYQSPNDLFFGDGGNGQPIREGFENFQDRVATGSGTSRGLEIGFTKNKGKLTGWFAYALAQADRVFPSINNGESFPYKYDRRHDINIGLRYSLYDHLSLTSSWVYGTGDTFSLAIDEFEGPFGIETFITNGQRNNHRFPPYHTLSFQINYKKVLSRGSLDINLGVNNVYNRRNVYYIYIYENPINGLNDVRKTTLFPFLPSLELGYSF